MCGIVGFVDTGDRPGLMEKVRHAAGSLRHRGPDDEGFLTIRSVGGRASAILGHRRLSIIDLSAAARQPMSLEDSGLHISFNGEIYNYRELRKELENGGTRFTTCSDTEVLLAAYRQWGAGCLTRFVGMFAFAILDLPANKLFLARDPFGIKPLFYACPPGGFVFASEIPPLLDMPGIGRRANPQRVFEFLNDGIADHGGETFFADISQLPAAHYLEVPLANPGEPVPVRYWDLNRAGEQSLSFKDAALRLRELFLESVSLHLRSDVPLGIALSGGIDSSATMGAARHLTGKCGELHSFSYIADDPAICEEQWVDQANRQARAIPHKVHIGGSDIAEDFEDFVALQGEPVPAPVAYAQWRVFGECKKAGVKVLLEGQGADELLAGYPIYAPERLASLLRNGQVWEGARFAHAISGSRRGQFRMLRAAAANLAGRAIAPPVFPWISSRWLSEQALRARNMDTAGGRFLMRNSMYDTLFATKIPAFLRWGDRSAMACSVENRVPFLTPRLAEFLYSLPEEYLLAGDGSTKAVFREAMRGLVPDSILQRRDKIGFTTPYSRWLRAMRPLCADLIGDLERIPALDHGTVAKACAGFLAGAEAPLPVVHHLWGVLFLTAWARRFDVVFD